MPKRGEGPKGPTWKGSKSPEEVARLNEKGAEELGLPKRGEANRDALLSGIDKELIAITRGKAEAILAASTDMDRDEADTIFDTYIKNNHPTTMISVIHGATEEVRKVNPVGYAAMATAFLALTEDY